ncbi:MAG: tRNA glutamyl-Q(34) synthetase GluQRS [Rhizobiaceae bacterium]|nr:MAG: tRNA glutamyl-Q(34) synthetase GluQRS [Rhizobiaceae bacterium]
MGTRIFRFAPSPNGRLHLGHAYSALFNQKLARQAGGRLLLRIEDIDTTRCTPEFEAGILEDLDWLGIEWERPVRRQSDHFAEYEKELARLVAEGLVYPAFMSRGEIRAHIADAEKAGKRWPRDPDGTPLYPGSERNLTERKRRHLMASGTPYAWRLDMKEALLRFPRRLTWQEGGKGPDGQAGIVEADPDKWGDVVLARREVPTSYHLSVVIDDAQQGVTDIVRGRDLFHATPVHRLLQQMLRLPEPRYLHHDLVLGPDGRKLSKSNGDTALCEMRQAGRAPDDIRSRLGFTSVQAAP